MNRDAWKAVVEEMRRKIAAASRPGSKVHHLVFKLPGDTRIVMMGERSL